MKAPAFLASFLFALMLHAAPAAETNPPVVFPDSPQGKTYARWIESLNTGDYAKMEAFQREVSPEKDVRRRAVQDYRMYLMTRGLTPVRIEKSTETEVTALCQEKVSGFWVNAAVRFSPVAPHPLTAVGLRPADPPADVASRPKLSEIDMLKEMDERLQRMTAADEFSGAVLVGHNGKAIFKKAYGLASRAWQIPNQVDTKFNLASMGKMFTAVAIAQLAEKGKLSFDDTVGKHLPDYPNKEVAEKVTIHQLLTHTSGMGDMFNAKYEAKKSSLRTVDDFVGLFAEDKLRFEPGAKWQYSNAGFVLLGAIVEKASGEDYYDYLSRHIFEPAGMINTGAFELDRDPRNLAIGYTRRNATTPEELRERKNNLFLHVVKGSPAGGSFSTVEDLLAFSNALLGHKLMGKEMTDRVLSSKSPTGGPGGERYAYGFQLDGEGKTLSFGHRGGFDGISADFKVYPELGYTTVVLCNYDNTAPLIGLKYREWITHP